MSFHSTLEYEKVKIILRKNEEDYLEKENEKNHMGKRLP